MQRPFRSIMKAAMLPVPAFKNRALDQAPTRPRPLRQVDWAGVPARGSTSDLRAPHAPRGHRRPATPATARTGYNTAVLPAARRENLRMPAEPKYKRILLKLSGEALLGSADYGIDPQVIGRLARETLEVQKTGVQVGIVIGGGNIFRGAGLAAAGMDRVTGDHMGMLATVMNALAFQDALEKIGARVRVMSAIKINEVCEDYIRRRAIRHLEKGRIAIFAAGTGNPFFTTDSAAALRSIEIGADLLLKATKVDGVYSADPKKVLDAERFERLSYDQVIERKLAVMDTAAIALCRDHRIPLRIYDMSREGDLLRIIQGQQIGTLVS
jgi:uridylate kinase